MSHKIILVQYSQGDLQILCDKVDMSFTKDWELIKIFPWRFSGKMYGLFL